MNEKNEWQEKTFIRSSLLLETFVPDWALAIAMKYWNLMKMIKE